ncbi:choice-of-anchor Q domain-containing protein, partial [Dokdonella sp.]|uniref:choice-of-anchor Q domain-containing protein n=1 Tax=Dokdonella sp. TaxID=2291710 RepID=UPI003C6047C4
DFTIRKLTLQNGRSTSTANGAGGGAAQLVQGNKFRFEEVNFVENGTFNGGGGAISAGPLIGNADSRLEIDRCHFFDNYGEDGGGAVFAFPASGGQVPSTISISDSLFDGNWSDGSGGALSIYGVATISLSRNQFIDNQADNSGGAIAISAPSTSNAPIVQIEKSSFITNESGLSGAASFSYVNVLMSNSTFAGNSAGDPGYGSAIRTFGTTSVAIQYSTFHENGAGTSSQDHVSGEASAATIFACNGCSVSLRSSIVWSASATDLDCSFDFNSAYTSLGSNLDGSGTCANTASDQIVADPRLLPLGGYGVPQTAFELQTMPPLPSSAAVDFGPANNCTGFFGANVTVDQRGLPRPVDGSSGGISKCDSGAIEYQPGVDLGEFALSVILAGTGSGSVSSDVPGIDCPNECSMDFVENSVVQLSAVASPGSQFSEWSGDCSGQGSCIVLIDQTNSVTANFIDANDFIFADGFEGDTSN